MKSHISRKLPITSKPINTKQCDYGELLLIDCLIKSALPISTVDCALVLAVVERKPDPSSSRKDIPVVCFSEVLTIYYSAQKRQMEFHLFLFGQHEWKEQGRTAFSHLLKSHTLIIINLKLERSACISRYTPEVIELPTRCRVAGIGAGFCYVVCESQQASPSPTNSPTTPA